MSGIRFSPTDDRELRLVVVETLESSAPSNAFVLNSLCIQKPENLEQLASCLQFLKLGDPGEACKQLRWRTSEHLVKNCGGGPAEN